MKFPDILTVLDFQCPETALKVKTTEVWCLLPLSYLVMSTSLNLERCPLSPCGQGGRWCFGIHPSKPGTSPLVILDVRLPSRPPWESAVGEPTILWGLVRTDLANAFWLRGSPFRSFHEPRRPCQIWLEWAWEGRSQTHEVWSYCVSSQVLMLRGPPGTKAAFLLVSAFWEFSLNRGSRIANSWWQRFSIWDVS